MLQIAVLRKSQVIHNCRDQVDIQKIGEVWGKPLPIKRQKI